MNLELQKISQLLNADIVQSCFMNSDFLCLCTTMGRITGRKAEYSRKFLSISQDVKKAKTILGKHVKCYKTGTVGELILFSGVAIEAADRMGTLSNDERRILKKTGIKVLSDLLINIPLEADRAFSKENEDNTDERSQNYDKMAE